ncbi:MAG: DUF421 domain-containing protein [Clostridia bacterium]|nr:DUF421 domain-containing protein [Clostridia bacterium]
MLTIFIRSIIIYIVLIIIMRLMGKRQLSELQPFEFAITLIIAELACIPMAEMQIPLMYGIIPIFTLFVLHLFITKLASKSVRFNKFLNGKPIIIITPKGIDQRLLSQLDMSVMDLLHALRASGFFFPSEIAYAILETDGKMSVLPKASAGPLTPKASNIEVDPIKLSYAIICDGVFESNNLEQSGIEESKIKDILRDNKLTTEDILLMTVDSGSEIYLQPKKGEVINIKV